MLLACNDCKRQYDTRDHAPGTELSCGCGATLVVPKPTRRSVKMQHCSACGAGLQPDSKFCAFCGAGVSLAERGLGPSCPQCLTRLAKGAAFCSGCGLDIKVQPIRRALSTRDCPRCERSLMEVTASEEGDQDLHFCECEGCGGIWLDEDTVDRLVRQTEEERPSLPPSHKQSRGPDASSRAVETVSYIPCPVCHNLMNRMNFGRVSGVVLDRCRGHGYWFDHDELQSVLDFVDRGGLQQTRQREREDAQARLRREQWKLDSLQAEARRRPKSRGAWWGWSAFGGELF